MTTARSRNSLPFLSLESSVYSFFRGKKENDSWPNSIEFMQVKEQSFEYDCFVILQLYDPLGKLFKYIVPYHYN